MAKKSSKTAQKYDFKIKPPAVSPGEPQPGVLAKALFVSLFFVSPLLFFTNLTRNPYFTQIVLMNMALIGFGLLWLARSWKNLEWRWLSSPVDTPWLAWIGVCLLSWLISFAGHKAFFRPAIAYEGLRVFLFLFINCFGAYLLGKAAKPSENPFAKPSGLFLLFAVWAGLWAIYPGMRGAIGPGEFWDRFFNPYGAGMWLGAIITAYFAIRKATREDLFHLALAAGGVAALYGVFQYFGFEPIWPTALNPYGARSVSSFGNPNFLSSYLVVLLPPLFVYFLKSSGGMRLIYGTLFMLFEMSLLCSLTRSSWLGAAAGLAFLAALPEIRALLRKSLKPVLTIAVLSLVIIPMWPSGTKSEYSPSVSERVKELKGMKKTSLPSVADRTQLYAPWHQRLLIWSDCTLMGLENPLTGKGWGTLELFYPFYQGPLLRNLPQLRDLRTHANNAHNEVIEVFSQTGVLGLGVRIWLFAALFAGFFYFRKTGKESLFAAGAAAGIAGMLADNTLNVSLHFSAPAFIFWWMAGTVARECSFTVPRRVEWKHRIANRIAAYTLAAVLLACGWIWFGQWMRELSYFRGFGYARRGETEKAVAMLERSARWGTPEVNALYELANSYARADMNDKALSTYQAALDTNAGYDEIYFNRAILLGRKMGRPGEAIDNLATGIWINPFNPRAYDLLADLCLSDKEKFAPRCVEYFRAAHELYPEDVALSSLYGVIAVAAGKNAEAEKVFGDAALKSPMSEMLLTNYRKVIYDSGRKTTPELDTIMQLRNLGAQVDAGQSGAALLGELDSLGKKYPDVEFPKILKARVFYLKKDYPAAEKVLSTVLAGNPNSVPGNSGMAAILGAKGNISEAELLLKRVTDADPHNKEVQQNMEIIKRGSQSQ